MSMCRTGGAFQVARSLLHNINLYPTVNKLIVNKSLLEHVPKKLLAITVLVDSIYAEILESRLDRSWLLYNVFTPVYQRSNAGLVITGFARPHLVYDYRGLFPGSCITNLKRGFKYRLVKWLINWSRNDLFICETESVSERALNVFGVKSRTVSNCLNPKLRNTRVERPERLGSKIRFLTVSSYYPHKRFELLNDVARELLRLGYKNFEFTVTIKESEWQGPMDFRDYFSFIGKVSLEELPKLYNSHDLLVYPTVLECFSASWIEGMYYEIPIITSDIPSARSVCRNAAHYAKLNDPLSFAKEIIHLISDDFVRFGLINKARNRFKELDINRDEEIAMLIQKKLSDVTDYSKFK